MSTYDDLKEEILSKVKATAKYIPDLCKALKSEGELSNEDIKDRIRKDFISVWSRKTIDENIPEEFKKAEKVERGKRSSEKVKEKKKQQQQIATTTTSGRTVTESVPATTENKDVEKLEKQLSKYKQQLQTVQQINKSNETELKELRTAQLEKAINELPPPPEKKSKDSEPRTHFHVIPLKDRQFFRDVMRFAKADIMLDEIYAKIENNALIRILSPEEKDQELEALASI